jgi:MFS family permease
VVGEKTRRFRLLVVALLTLLAAVIGNLLTESLLGQQSWLSRLGWFLAGIIVIYLLLRWQSRSLAESPEAIDKQVKELTSKLRSEVKRRSYGARSELIEDPLKEPLDLDITPRVGWGVRDPSLTQPEPLSKTKTDIGTAFASSKRRLLIVGAPGSGKTMAAYSLIQHLDETEGDKRIPLLVNLSAWEGQSNFEAFLVDYLCSEVGYQVRERAVANAFIGSGRYSLILDGLDEIFGALRTGFAERLNEFVSGLHSRVAVVVTCRIDEYKELLAAHPTGLGLVQAVEVLPLSDEQLDSAFVELAKQRDKEWELFVSQRDLTAYQRVRHLLSNPLFLNLAVVGDISPGQLLDWTTTKQELRDLVLDRYIDHIHRQYRLGNARRYLTWIARFLNGAEVSPFGPQSRPTILADPTVFDLANLTPLDPPKRHRLLVGLVFGLFLGLVGGLFWGPVGGLMGLIMLLAAAFPGHHEAAITHLALVWPSTKQQLGALLRKLYVGLVSGLLFGWLFGLLGGLFWLLVAIFWGLLAGLAEGLIEHRPVLVTSRTPKDTNSRALIAALTYGLPWGLIVGLSSGVFGVLFGGLLVGPLWGLACGLSVGLLVGLHSGGWFVLLQKVAHRSLARAGSLPLHPGDFLKWGIERQIFRQVGGGVRFRHNLIQQHLANTSEGVS